MIIIVLTALIACIIIWFFLCAPNTRRKRAASFAGTLFAHRGLHSIDCAENSLEAFERACRAGYGIELDIQFTRDRQLVVFHDDNALRMTGCDKLIREMTLEEVRALRLVTDNSAIPTFREVLDTVNGRVPLLVEIKTCPNIRELTEAAAGMLVGYDGNYVIESFNPFCLSTLRKCAPNAIRGQPVTGRKEYLKDQTGVVAFALSQLLLNVIARPDIAYNIKAPVTAGLWLHKKLFRTLLRACTITDVAQVHTLSAARTMPIFEKCKPKKIRLQRKFSLQLFFSQENSWCIILLEVTGMRLFIGISIPDRVKKQISNNSASLGEHFPGKYTAHDTYHITLAYIGECDDEMHEKVLCAMADCASRHMPFSITTGRADYFGKPDKGILHIRADSDGLLYAVAADLRTVLSASRIPFDPKALNAHITLARKCCVDMSLSDILLPRYSFTAMGLTLFHSCRVDDILKYIPIHFETFTGERSCENAD